MLRGEPGVGKTAILQYAEGRAQGMIVLRARGLEDEAELAFSGLADLFRPVVDQLRRIPPAQGAALAGALGLGPPGAGDRCVVWVGPRRRNLMRSPWQASIAKPRQDSSRSACRVQSPRT